MTRPKINRIHWKTSIRPRISEQKNSSSTNFWTTRWVDSKALISQVQELQVLLHDIHAKKVELSKSFQVAAIIENSLMYREFQKLCQAQK